jgi:adenosylcobinamide-phosphate synthase
MNVIAILAALGLEQWRAFQWRSALEHSFIQYARAVERKLNGGTAQHAAIATLVALVPPVLFAAGIYVALHALHPLLGLAWNVTMLYLLMGFRRFSHLYTNVEAALKANDLTAARRALTAWRGVPTGELSSGEIAKLAIERGLVDSYRQVFATLFWFTVLPGPAGAVLYRAAALLAEEWKADAKGADTTPIAQGRAVIGAPARGLLWLLDWVPARLTALSFAIVGDFEDAVYCWRTQARTWPAPEAGIVLAAGAGAMGVRLGMPVQEVDGMQPRPELGAGEEADGPFLDTTVGMLWRALVLWVAVLAGAALVSAFARAIA